MTSAKTKSNRRILHEGRYLRLVRKGRWEFVERIKCSGIVVVLPVTERREIVFIEQHRIPIDQYVIEFPAGLVNDADDRPIESLEEGARRELWEETGYAAKRMKVIFEGPVS